MIYYLIGGVFTFGMAFESLKTLKDDFKYYKLAILFAFILILIFWPFCLGIHLNELMTTYIDLSAEDEDEDGYGLGDWWKRN